MGAPTREEELDHPYGIRTCRPGERRGRELVIPRCDVGAGVEQDTGEFHVPTFRIGPARQVQQRLVLPVHQVRAHAARPAACAACQRFYFVFKVVVCYLIGNLDENLINIITYSYSGTYLFNSLIDLVFIT